MNSGELRNPKEAAREAKEYKKLEDVRISPGTEGSSVCKFCAENLRLYLNRVQPSSKEK